MSNEMYASLLAHKMHNALLKYNRYALGISMEIFNFIPQQIILA